MKRFLLDTNIYGEFILDRDLVQLKTEITQKIIVHGFKIIRNELRDIPKNIKLEQKNLRIALLHLYDELVSKDYELTIEMEKLAQEYFLEYKRRGGSQSIEKLTKDFTIVACAAYEQIDIVVSEDNKSILTENALAAYTSINEKQKLRTPQFIGYLEFKRLLNV